MSTRSARSSSNVNNSQSNGNSDVENLSDAPTEEWHNEEVQDPDERRGIRHRYRELIAKTQQENEPDTKQLKDNLNEAQELFSKVRMPREAALDSKLLRQLSTVGMRKAETLHTNMVSFDPVDFAERLTSFVSNSGSENDDVTPEEWGEFGKLVTVLYRRSPVFHYMLGSFARTPPETPAKTPRARANKDLSDNKKSTAPVKINEMGKSDQEVTTEEVERVYAILKSLYEKNNRNPICFFEFVIHPKSFAKTIQNIFHTSFLIKDGYANVYLDSDELPVIEPFKDDGGSQSQVSNKKELVMSINYDQWQMDSELNQFTPDKIPS